MKSYGFKPNWLRRRQTWLLEGRELRSASGRSVSLDEVEGGRFADIPLFGRATSYIDLYTPSGKFRIACSDAASGSHRAEYLALVQTVLLALMAVSSSARFSAGAEVTMRLIFLVIGAAMIIGPMVVFVGNIHDIWNIRGLAVLPFVGSILAAIALVSGPPPWLSKLDIHDLYQYVRRTTNDDAKGS